MGVIAIHYHGGNRKMPLSGFGKDLLQAIRENRAFSLLSLVLLVGMVLGSLYARSADASVLQRLDFLFAGNWEARQTQPFLMVFSAAFASSFLFIFACFLCGLSMWGAFFIPVILTFRGFGLGLTSGYLYVSFGWKGILYNLAVILPGAFFCCLAILFAAGEGIRYSRMLAAQNTHSASTATVPVSRYFLRFGTILAWACAAAVLDTLLSAFFGGCFTFS